jgi:glycosyltransferase involved in cell wall biosynthesis
MPCSDFSPSDWPRTILQVSPRDHAGGAEQIALALHRAYRAAGHDAWLAVGRRRGSAAQVVELPHEAATSGWSRGWWRLHRQLQPYYSRGPLGRLACRITHRLAAPAGWLAEQLGREDFSYPGAWRVPLLTPRPPDVIHLHNLHGRYFDLRALPWLSRQAPLFLTLHDGWLFTGHCAHSLNCERWRTGCGRCPQLQLYPAVKRDATAANWRHKRALYARSRYRVAAPCRWLLERSEQSILARGMIATRVIPHGVDLERFRPGPAAPARRILGLPEDARLLLFVAHGARRNPWKDFATLAAAAALLAHAARVNNPPDRSDRPIIFLIVGDEGPPIRHGRVELRFIPTVAAPEDLVRYYHAADLYVHAARMDTFPNTVLEALACGRPVVASAVGGIPEQLRALSDWPGSRATPAGQAVPAVHTAHGHSDAHRATGLLVPPGDAEALAFGIHFLLDQPVLCARLGENAARDARERFGLRRMVADYLEWYAEAADRPVPRQARGESAEMGNARVC